VLPLLCVDIHAYSPEHRGRWWPAGGRLLVSLAAADWGREHRVDLRGLGEMERCHLSGKCTRGINKRRRI